jgi:hypothetical protein
MDAIEIDKTRTGKDRHLSALKKNRVFKISNNNLHMNETYNPIL